MGHTLNKLGRNKQGGTAYQIAKLCSFRQHSTLLLEDKHISVDPLVSKAQVRFFKGQS